MNTQRSADLRVLLERLKDAFASIQPQPDVEASLRRVFSALDLPAGLGGATPGRLPACSWLQTAFAGLQGAAPPLKALGEAFEDIEPQITWRRRGGPAPAASTSFQDGHATGMIIGPGGIENRTDAWVGVSLLAPHVRYPDHTHPPEEVYLVLSPGRFAQRGGAWFEPGIGGSFYNEPGILHAMASDDAPLLAFWCLYSDPEAKRPG